MERVFTQDIKNGEGEVKFRAGETRDWPKPTWQQVAISLGMDKDAYKDFSMPLTDAASLTFAKAAKEKSEAKPAKSSGKPQRRTLQGA